MASFEIIRVSPRNVRTVLRHNLATATQRAADLERHVNSFIEYARAMSFDLSLQWICQAEGQTLAACSCIESPGRTALLLLPASDCLRVDPAAFQALLQHIIKHERGRDIQLIQTLILVEDDANRRALEEAGFCEIALMHYLELRLKDAYNRAPIKPPASFRQSSVRWIPYSIESHPLFSDLIVATYEGSLDCPGLSELRQIGDVLEGHKAAGRFDPQRWRLLMCDNEPAACILLSENPLQSMWEVVYMGVHPRHRSKRMGHYVLSTGLEMAYRAGIQAVSLAVDSRNTPARRLYDNVGFRVTTRRRAMLLPIAVTSIKT